MKVGTRQELGRRSNLGFTIAELLIVIVVIAILAAIVIVAFNGIQARARDGKRAEDARNFAQIIESYYVTNGYYPPYNPAAGVGVADATWRAANLANLKDGVITPPTASSISLVNNSAPTISQYGYFNNGSCTGSGSATQCAQVRIYWKSEVDGSTHTYTGSTG